MSPYLTKLKWPLLIAATSALVSSSVSGAGHGPSEAVNALHLDQNQMAGTTPTSVVGFAPTQLSVTSAHVSGTGIHGGASSTAGLAIGVSGTTLSTFVSSAGVQGTSSHGQSEAAGVRGRTDSSSTSARGVEGVVVPTSPGNLSAGVRGINNSTTSSGFGIWGSHSGGGAGVYGTINSDAANAAGVRGQNNHMMCCGMGVAGFHSGQGIGIYGESPQGFAVSGFSPNNWSGYFQGDVRVVGNLQKNSGSFTIDHPLDPQNKYLSHSFVESPDMKNVYDGVVVTDPRGFATVGLPHYFSALNRDFRYQLTTIGRHADAWIAKEIANNRFALRTEKPFVKVSWQVTGIRKDAWANAHRIKVEELKKASEAGKYLNPELYGKPATKSVVVLPGMKHSAGK